MESSAVNFFEGGAEDEEKAAEIIERHFAITYHRDHIGRLITALGWSYQKTDKRPLQRDEQTIEEWKSKQRPRIKNRSTVACPHCVYRRIRIAPNPADRRTWGQRGHTPIIRYQTDSPAHFFYIRHLG